MTTHTMETLIHSWGECCLDLPQQVVVDHSNARVDMRDVRGPNWDWGDQDGHGPGTIVKMEYRLHGWAVVEWDEKNSPENRNSYRIGPVLFDLMTADNYR